MSATSSRLADWEFHDYLLDRTLFLKALVTLLANDGPALAEAAQVCLAQYLLRYLAPLSAHPELLSRVVTFVTERYVQGTGSLRSKAGTSLQPDLHRAYAALLHGLVTSAPDRLVRPSYAGLPQSIVRCLPVARGWAEAVRRRSGVLTTWIRPPWTGLQPVYHLLLELGGRCRRGGVLLQDGGTGAHSKTVMKACQGLLKPYALTDSKVRIAPLNPNSNANPNWIAT